MKFLNFKGSYTLHNAWLTPYSSKIFCFMETKPTKDKRYLWLKIPRKLKRNATTRADG